MKRPISGQILVMALLISVIGLTIGLSVASRSVTGIKQTSSFEASNRAFSAAEAGIEEALQKLRTVTPGNPLPTGSQNLSGSNFNYQTTSVGGGSAYQVDGVLKDDTVEVKLVSGGPTSSINVYWTKPVDPTAIVSAIIINNSGSYSLKKAATYCGGSRGPFAGFTDVTPGTYTISSSTYNCLTNIPIPANASALRLRLMCVLCNSANLAVVAQGNLPSGDVYQLPPQSYLIRSVGSAAGTQRTVEVIESLPSLPSIFDYVLFSGSTSQPLSQ